MSPTKGIANEDDPQKMEKLHVNHFLGVKGLSPSKLLSKEI